MPDIDQTVAASVKPPPPAPDLVGPITSLAQMSYWAAQGQKAAADAAKAQQDVAGAQASLSAKQDAYSGIQGGADPSSVIPALSVYDAPGANAMAGNIAATRTLNANKAYAAANPGNPMAIAGPEAAAKVYAPAQAGADVQSKQLANAQANTQLFGQIGTMMASDPSPAGRQQAAAFAQQAGAPPQMIQQFMALPDDQYVAAGKHFQAASMAPEKYMDVSGQSAFNKGVAEASTFNKPLGPGETLAQGPAAHAAFYNQPLPPQAVFGGPAPGPAPTLANPTPTPQVAPAAPVPTNSQGVALNPNGTPTQAGNPFQPGFGPKATAAPPPAATPVPQQPPAGPQSGPNYYGTMFSKEGLNNPTGGNGGGIAQFEAGTAASVRANHPELGLSANFYKDNSPQGIQQQIAASRALTMDNAASLAKAGIAVNDKNVYMAHFLGDSGAAKFITAAAQNPNAPAASLFPTEAKANPSIFFANGQPRSLGEVYALQTRGFGNGLSINGPAGAGIAGVDVPGGAPGAPTGGVVMPPGGLAAPPPAFPGVGQKPLAAPAQPALAPPPAQGQPPAAQAAPPTAAPIAAAAPGQPGVAGAPVVPPAAGAPTGNLGYVPVTSGLSKSVVAEQEEQGKAYGQLPQQLSDAADAAKVSNNTLDEMQMASKSWTPGKWADVKENVKESTQAVLKQMGVNTPNLDQQVGDYQTFQKLALQLPAQAAKELGSQTGVQELTMLSKSFPSTAMAGSGLDIVVPQLKGLNDFRIAKQQAAGGWKTANGNSLGPMPQAGGKDFQTIWNENASPTAFVVHRMSQENPQALQAALTRMKGEPGGQAALDNIIKQTQWAHDAGLLQ